MTEFTSQNPGWGLPGLIRLNSCPGDKVQLIDSARQANIQAKELSMVASNIGVVPADPKQERVLTVDGGAQRPMSQQDAADSHGHEMHPQKFVRLVGCHESNAGRHEAADRLH